MLNVTALIYQHQGLTFYLKGQPNHNADFVCLDGFCLDFGESIGVGVFERKDITEFGVSYQMTKVQQSTTPHPFPMLTKEFVLWHRQEVIEQEKKVFVSQFNLS